MDMKEYVFFSNLSGTAIRLKFCDTLEELLTVINSCKLFIGNFSAPLQFAFACNKPTMGILMPGLLDNIHMMNFPSYIKHYQSIM
jgi:ADP-heptose:LPS heptosyltransferase